jgi:radical SAM superfamily enzyme YgiQ (UPF0313 family)
MRPYAPLGLLYLSSYLKSKGFDVGIYDSTFQTFPDFSQHLDEARAPVVGIYANMMTRATVLQMLPLCRERGATVVVGGPDPANYPEDYLERGADVVVIGEGELTLEELLPHLARHGPRRLAGIRGLAYREGDRVVTTPPRPYIQDLDGLPFPDRAAIDVGQYLDVWRQHHGEGSLSLITARGCPYHCRFCSHAVFGYTHRRRSPENVADEVEELLHTYRPDTLWYSDDVFTLQRRWLSDFAASLKRRQIAIPFETTSREDRLDEEVVRTLAEMGARRVWIGAESGSQRILDAMERDTDAERVPEVVRLLQRYGIQAGLFIMLGYEGEEISDLEATLDLLRRSSPDLFLTTLAYPIKGTPYYAQVQDRVVSPKPWHLGSDRDHSVRGRRSSRFYRYATRWLVGEMSLHEHRLGRRQGRLSAAKARLGRLGMSLTKGMVEGGRRRG